MLLHDDGCISRPSRSLKPSGDWRCCGAVTRNNLGGVTKRYSLADVLRDAPSIPWRFKNGKQRTHLLDLDHGTLREWCSPDLSVS
jgi:hypothetical protein